MKRSAYEVKKRILFRVAEGKANFSDIQKGTRTNYDTVKNHIEELSNMGIVEIDVIEKAEANGQRAYEVSLTSLGEQVVSNMKEQ